MERPGGANQTEMLELIWFYNEKVSSKQSDLMTSRTVEQFHTNINSQAELYEISTPKLRLKQSRPQPYSK